MSVSHIIIYLSGYLILLLTSGIVVKNILKMISQEDIIANVEKKKRDAGFIIGKCENILLLTFVLVNQYTALAIIFTAKGIIRKEDIEKNSLFFLAGTLINVSYSVSIGLIVKIILKYI